MKVIYRTKWGFKLAEVWNYEGDPECLPDELLVFDGVRFRDARANVMGSLSPFVNGILTFDRPIAELPLNKKFLYEVNRAKMEGASFVADALDGVSLHDIHQDFTSYLDSKGLLSTPENLLDTYRTADALRVTTTQYQGRNMLYHIYFFDAKCPTLLASFPSNEFRDMNLPSKYFGWFNRFLHYWDIDLFMTLKCSHYNIGGMGNPITPATEGIVKFKQEIVDSIRTDFHGFIALSPLIKIFRNVRSVLKGGGG